MEAPQSSNTINPYNNTALILRNSNFESRQALRAFGSTEEIAERVENKIQSINIGNSSCLSQLKPISGALASAFEHGREYSCAVPIMDLICDFQSVAGDTQITVQKCIQAAMTALRKHQSAHRVFLSSDSQLDEKGKLELSLEFLSQSIDIAKEMENACDQLVVRYENLCKKSQNALVEATKNDSMNAQQKRDLQRQIEDFKASEARLKSTVTLLAEQIAEKKQKEREIEEECKNFRRMAMGLKIAGTVALPVRELFNGMVKPVLNGAVSVATQFLGRGLNLEAFTKQNEADQKELLSLVEQVGTMQKELEHAKEKKDEATINRLQANIAGKEALLNEKRASIIKTEQALRKAGDDFEKQAASLKDKELQIAKTLADLQTRQLEDSSSLAEARQRLTDQKVSIDSVEKAVAALKLTIAALAKARTVFTAAKVYWTAMEIECQSAYKEMKDGIIECKALGSSEFSRVLVGSAVGWTAMGLLFDRACLAIEDVNRDISISVCVNSNDSFLLDTETVVRHPRIEEIKPGDHNG